LGEGHGNELLLAIIARHEGGELEGVVRVEEHPVEAVVDVELAQVDFAFRGVGVTQDPEKAGQAAPKLHDFLGQVGDGVLVDAEPGVVDEYPGPAVEFVLDSHGGESKVAEG
jgi:hypothetical protein